MKWIKYSLWCVAVALVLLPCVLIGLSSSQKLTDREIMLHAKRLNEAAAIQIPHFFLMGEQLRSQNLKLLQKVETGMALDDAESTAYRLIFQKTLFENQRFLSRFDGELSVMRDVGMILANNVKSHGIKGNHDHHDVSARPFNFRVV